MPAIITACSVQPACIARVRRVAALAALCLCLILPALTGSEIHTAAAAGDLTQVKALLKAHPELLDTRDGDGRTPLSLAAGAGNLELVQYFESIGADVNAKDHAGLTPLAHAEAAHHTDVANELRHLGAGAVDFSKVNDTVISGGTWCIFAAVAAFGLLLFFLIITRKKRSPEDLLADEMNDQG